MLAVGGCLKTPNIFHLDTPVIWTVLYVIIHGSLFKLEFKTTNFRILVCRKDKKGWTRFDLRPDYEIVDQRLLSACQLIAKLRVQRLVSGFFFYEQPGVTRSADTASLLPVSVSRAPWVWRAAVFGPHAAAATARRSSVFGKIMWHGFGALGRKELSVPAHLDFTSPSGTFPHPDWLLTRIETDLR